MGFNSVFKGLTRKVNSPILGGGWYSVSYGLILRSSLHLEQLTATAQKKCLQMADSLVDPSMRSNISLVSEWNLGTRWMLSCYYTRKWIRTCKRKRSSQHCLFFFCKSSVYSLRNNYTLRPSIILTTFSQEYHYSSKHQHRYFRVS